MRGKYSETIVRFIIGIHYTKPFSITEAKEKWRDRGEKPVSSLRSRVRSCGVSKVFAVFFFFFLRYFEIQTETTMNHVLIDSTRDPLLPLFPPSLECIEREAERKGRRVWHRKTLYPFPYRLKTKDGRLLLIVDN